MRYTQFVCQCLHFALMALAIYILKQVWPGGMNWNWLWPIAGLASAVTAAHWQENEDARFAQRDQRHLTGIWEYDE